jgi:hypothetical protein
MDDARTCGSAQLRKTDAGNGVCALGAAGLATPLEGGGECRRGAAAAAASSPSTCAATVCTSVTLRSSHATRITTFPTARPYGCQ